MKKVSDNDDVFILRGELEDEIYIIDDPVIIAKFDAKILELKGRPETEIQRYLLHIVNPDRYKLPANGK